MTTCDHGEAMAKIVEDTDVASVALAALTKMVSLLAAELVVGEQPAAQ